MEKYLEDFKKSKLVIYTIITGNYDTLKEPEFIDDNCDYICFTDNKELTSKTWQIQLIKNTCLDNTRFQRKYKVLPHKFLTEYEYSVYIDGNVRIIGSIRAFVEKEWKGAPLLGLKHPSRNNIYDEAKACINLNKDLPEIINKQIDRYRNEGYSADNGLTVTNIIFRKNKDAKLIKVMEDWWKEILNNSKRDQLSFCYVCWKNNFDYDISELKCYRSDYWLNPGIHTNNIRDVEIELIDHIQLADYHQSLLNQKDEYIALKKREYESSLAQNERMFEIELQKKETILKEQKKEYIKRDMLKEQKHKKELEEKDKKYNTLLANRDKCERKMSLKIQELEDAITSKEQEINELLELKNQELCKVNNELEVKTKEVSDIKSRLEQIEHTLSWRYTAIFRRIFAKK